jgi:DNA-binding SARP family transcriptional activator/tetratricopeptide (TPR) repeat protein
MSDTYFRALGPLEVGVAGRSVVIEASRQQVILGTLLLARGRPVTVEQLIDAVWADAPPSTARGQVQICVSALRRGLGRQRIVTHATGYSLRLDDASLDLVEFDRRITAARAATTVGRPVDAVENLRAALGLWRGPALAGVSSRSVEAAAARLEDERMSAIEELMELELDLGRHRELTGELVELVAAHPLRERLRGLLMVALYRSGRQAEALAVFREARRHFIEELGLELGEPLRHLEQAILTHDAELDLAEPANRTGVAGRSVEAVVAREDAPRQLPPDIADFTGRPELVEHLVARILDDSVNPAESAVPIWVVTGPGGVGKTTLAIRVAHLVRDAFPDGQLFANLRGSHARPLSPDEVLGRFLRALGVLPAAIGGGLDERAETYRSCLAGRRLLVVLDDAGDERQVLPLLPGLPGCTVIVTSRHRLSGLAGARGTDVAVFDTDNAMGLLTEVVGRARIAAEPLAAVSLVALCGGLPLALRIVGARLAARPHWRLDSMVVRLTNERDRLDELAYGELDVRASLLVTFEGLSPRARRLFRLLGVVDAPHFAPWTAAVLLGCGPDAVATLIDELVDVRLLEVESADTVGGADQHGTDVDATRYRFHDLVRVFARERLHAEESMAEQMSALVRLLGGYLTLVEAAHRRIYGGDYTVLHGAGQRWQPAAEYLEGLIRNPLGWFEAERPGLLAATRQAAEADLDELCWDLAVTAVTLFEARGYYDDWRATHELALAATRRAGNLRGEAATLCSLGSLGMALRGKDDRYLLRRALHLFQRLGEDLGTSLAQRNLAHFDHMQGRLDEAVAGYGLALAGFRRVGDRVAEAHLLAGVAQVHLDRGDLARTEALLNESLSLARAIGTTRVAAQTSHRLGELLLRQGRLEEAEARFREVLTTVRRTGDRVGQVYALTALGLVYTALRRFPTAEELLTEAYELWRTVGGRQAEARVLYALGRLRIGQRELAGAEECLARAAAGFAAQQATIWHARVLDALGEVHALAGRLPAAATAWAEASAMANADPDEVDSLHSRGSASA